MASTIAFFIYLLFAPLTSTYYECHQGKLIGQAWKELGESEKAEWNEKAKKDKLRYQKEMEDYSAPSDDDDSSDDDSDGGKGKKKAKAKSKPEKKDPNAPKRPKNAYMFYADSVRAQIREENPDLSMPDVVRKFFFHLLSFHFYKPTDYFSSNNR